jgi:hypothetical protein
MLFVPAGAHANNPRSLHVHFSVERIIKCQEGLREGLEPSLVS